MKVIIIIALASAAISSISCSKNRFDVTESHNKDFIIGNWDFIQSDDKGTKTTVNGKDSLIENIRTTYSLMPNEYEHTTFEKNNNVTTNSFIKGYPKNYSGNYTINYNKISIIQTSQDDNYIIRGTITELNSTTLKIDFDYQESIRPNVMVKTKRTNTYKKIK